MDTQTTSFVHSDGETYTLRITGKTHELIKASTGISVFRLFDDMFEQFRELFSDYHKVSIAIWIAAGKPGEQATFCDGLTGQVLADARQALKDAITFFLPEEDIADYRLVLQEHEMMFRTQPPQELVMTLDQLGYLGREPTDSSASETSINSPDSSASTPEVMPTGR